MSVRGYQQDDKGRWDAYVMGMPNSDCYHLTGWKEVIERVFGHDTCYLLSEDKNGNINGVLPLVHLKSLLFGNFMVSLPYFNYGGVCANNAGAREELIKAAVEIAEKRKINHLELRQSEVINEELQIKTNKVSMKMDLSSDSEKLWNAFPSKLRSQIKKAQKLGLYAKIAKTRELVSFFEVFSKNMRDLGTPVYPLRLFRSILTAFPESTWICTVYLERRPIASGFLIGYGKNMEIPWASSDRSYNRLCPNMLLYWSCLRFASEGGYETFDFGRSTKGSGTYRFKEQWGAKPHRLYWHYWLKKGGSMPEINPDNPRYRLAVNLWKRLPLSLSRIIGPVIVKNIP